MGKHSIKFGFIILLLTCCFVHKLQANFTPTDSAYVNEPKPNTPKKRPDKQKFNLLRHFSWLSGNQQKTLKGKKPRRRKKTRKDKSYRLALKVGTTNFTAMQLDAVMLRYDKFLVTAHAEVGYLPLSIEQFNNIKPFSVAIGVNTFFANEMFYVGFSTGKSFLKWNGTVDNLGERSTVEIPTSIYSFTPKAGIKFGKRAYVATEVGYSFMSRTIDLRYESSSGTLNFKQDRPNVFLPFVLNIGFGIAF